MDHPSEWTTFRDRPLKHFFLFPFVHNIIARQLNEHDIILALNALQKNPKLSLRQVISTYNIPRTTLKRRQDGQSARCDTEPNSRKLTSYEEESIIQYIINLDSRSFPPRLSSIREMADRLLYTRDAPRVGKN